MDEKRELYRRAVLRSLMPYQVCLKFDFPISAPVSITENTSIDEFLSNAEAAQRSFEVNELCFLIMIPLET